MGGMWFGYLLEGAESGRIARRLQLGSNIPTSPACFVPALYFVDFFAMPWNERLNQNTTLLISSKPVEARHYRWLKRRDVTRMRFLRKYHASTFAKYRELKDEVKV
jgi:hypothetical protein